MRAHARAKFRRGPPRSLCALRANTLFGYCARKPPSTGSVWPVTIAEARLTR
jgi:hypothetical protein